MNYSEDINAAVRRLVQLALGLPDNYMRPSDQTADAGKQGIPFGTVKIITSADASEPSNEIENIGTDLDPSYVEASYVADVVVASVQFYKSAPQPADLDGANASANVADYTGVTNGGFDIPIDNVNRKISALDFSAALTMDDVAAVVQARVRAALFSSTALAYWTGARFVITSGTTGTSSAMGTAVAPTTVGAVNVSTLLGLTAAAGASPSDNLSGIARWNLDAFDLARRLPQRLSLSENVIRMQELGLGFMSASPARNLAALSDATYEGRGSIDLTFNVISREAVAIAALTSADIGIEYQSPDGSIIDVDINLTPPP